MPSSSPSEDNKTPPKEEPDCPPEGGGCEEQDSAGQPSTPESCSGAPVRYGSGQIQYAETDLASRGFGIAWGHSRSYANILDPNEGGINGNSWLVRQLSFLTFVDAAPGNSEPDEIVLVDSGNQSQWFEKDTGAGSGVYKATFWSPVDLRHDAQAREYTWTGAKGDKRVFYDNDLAHAAELRGALKKIVDRFGNVTTATYDVNDELEEIEWAGGGKSESYGYDYYDTLPHIGLLERVTHRVDGVATKRISYEYYGTGDSRGSLNDLKKVTIEEYDPDADSWTEVSHSHYRYWLQGQAKGFEYGLKYVLGPQEYANMLDAGIKPETASDAQVAAFAAHYFEYDNATDRRVSKEQLRGGGLTHSYAYTANPDAPGYSAVNTWAVKTVETLPDGNQNRVYTSKAGKVILKIFKETSSGDEWYDYCEYAAGNGWPTLRATSAAVSSVTEPSGGSTALTVTLNASSGLIRGYDYWTADNLPAGEVRDFPKTDSVKEGANGTPQVQRKRKWDTRTVGGVSLHPLKEELTYPTAGMGDNDAPKTKYARTWYSGSFQVEQLTTTLPVVPTSENGDGQEHSTKVVYDELGGLAWEMDARGYITHRVFDDATDATVQLIKDVDTTLWNDVPAGWTTPAGGGLNLVTDYVADGQGRTVRELGPAHDVQLDPDDDGATSVQTTTFNLYKDNKHGEWSARGYATGNAPGNGFATVGEVSLTRKDYFGRVIDEIGSARDCDCGPLSPAERFPQGAWTRWTRHFYDNWGREAATRVYHDIPESGEGLEGLNYRETRFAHDSMGNLVRTRGPDGTITRTVYNSRNLPVETWVGTDDSGATDSDPGGGGASGNNMVEVGARQYDGGSAGGNGLVTRETFPVDGTPANDRVVDFTHTFRGQVAETKVDDGDTVHITKNTHDNLGQVTQVDRYHTSVAAGNLVGRRDQHWDSRRRNYKSETYAVDPSTGTVGNALVGQSWRDANGNVVKEQAPGSEAFTKTQYDGLNQPTATYLAHNSGTSSNDNDVSGDVVVEQVHTDYDAAGNVVETASYQRFDDATGNGALNGPNGSQPKARVSYLASWPDAIGRERASANYGSNGGAELIRPGVVPEPSDTVLVSTNDYRMETAGIGSATDPKGITTRWMLNNAGRRVKLVENYTGGPPSGDSDRTTEYGYHASGQLELLTLKNDETGDQVTRWLFGTTLADSGVASNELLRAKIYPASDDRSVPLGDGPDGEFERIEFGYNRQGGAIKVTDPNGTVHEYDYNKLGREIQDRITAFASGVDDAVKRIATEYNTIGKVSKVTSYDNATVGAGNVLNEVVREYDAFGQLQDDKQSHSGAVDGSTPKVAYAHEDGSSGNTARRKSITYPDGRIIDIGYGSASSADDLMSRIASLKINNEGSNLADYIYLGLAALAKASYPEPGVDLSYIKVAGDPMGDAGDPYTGYDRFNRSVDLRWSKTNAGTLLDEWLYGYDRASQRTWKSNYAATAGDDQDDFYNYDGLYQVTRAARGELNLNQTAIGAIPAKEETFLYDPTGNWDRYVEKSAGTIDLDQSRKNNKDNQITQFDGSSENVAYDKAGNAMKMLPDTTGDWTKYYHLKWDAWNRLVEVRDSAGAVVAIYAYDGTTRRITKTTGAVVTHFYYNDQWKCVEERVDSSTDPERQYAWGILFRNDLILRDRDTTGNGTLDERLYATHDALGNCTAILNASGAVQERYGYSAFGVRRIMQADFSARASSSFVWDFGFQGEFLDDETGYINYGYRCFLPYVGRWINRDPIGEVGGVNLYGFVQNDGVNYVDVFGLTSDCDDCDGEEIGTVSADVINREEFVGGESLSEWWKELRLPAAIFGSTMAVSNVPFPPPSSASGLIEMGAGAAAGAAAGKATGKNGSKKGNMGLLDIPLQKRLARKLLTGSALQVTVMCKECVTCCETKKTWEEQGEEKFKSEERMTWGATDIAAVEQAAKDKCS